MDLYEQVKTRKAAISVIGLGYVGLPLAVSFAKVANVVGFDIAKQKIERYLQGIDVTNEVGNEALKNTTALLTWDEDMQQCKFHIIEYQLYKSRQNTKFRSSKEASKTVGKYLTKGSIVT